MQQCTTVIVGAWNKAIFTPKWVSERIFEGREVSFALHFGVLPAIKLVCDQVELQLMGNRLQFTPLQLETRVFEAVQAAAVAVVDRLKETPVEAVGINFGFAVEHPSVDLDGYLSAVRQPVLGRAEVVATEVRLSMARPRSGAANILLRSTDERSEVDVNFNWPIADTAVAADVIRAQDYAALMQEGQDLAGLLLHDQPKGKTA